MVEVPAGSNVTADALRQASIPPGDWRTLPAVGATPLFWLPCALAVLTYHMGLNTLNYVRVPALRCGRISIHGLFWLTPALAMLPCIYAPMML